MNDLVSRSPVLVDLRDSERRVAEIERAVLTPWKRAFRARDAAAFQQLLAPGAVVPAWGSTQARATRTVDGVTESTWTPGAAATPSETATYLAAFSRFDHLQADVVRARSTDQEATLTVRFDLRGVQTDGARRQDRGELEFTVRKEAGTWRVTTIAAAGALARLTAASSRSPVFEDATASLGLDRVPQDERREAIRRGGYAITVSDYDNDGRPDMLVGNWGPAQLFHNTGNGFEDVTAQSGIGTESLVKSAAFADMDGDGLQDLLLVRFVEGRVPAQGMDPDIFDGADGSSDFVAYRNLGNGRFERRGNVLRRNHRYDRSMPLSIADFDGDGRLDVYVGFPGGRDFTNNLSRVGGRRDRFHQGLWLNRGGWDFMETRQLAESEPNLGVFPHGALAADLNEDGRPDLLVLDDSGRPSSVYRNEGRGEFREVAASVGLAVPSWAMGVSAGDYDGDGHVDLVFTNIAFAGGERARAYLADRRAAGLPQRVRDELLNNADRGVHLFHNRGNGTFEEVTDQAGVAWSGAGNAGSEFVDYNSDGLLDLFVANGLWSGGEEDVESTFLLLSYDRDARDPRLEDLAMSMPGASGPGANPMLIMMREFRGTLSNPTGPAISELPTLSLGGHQRDRLFRNNGDGTFTDVGYFENADRTEDGYMIAPVDLDLDGRQDLVLRNCDGTPGRLTPAVVALHNRGASGRSLVVSLHADSQNLVGVGARVTAVVGGRTLLREIRAASGAMQTTPTAFFGLGTADRVESLSVRWPNGRVERFQGVPAGRVELRQGTGT